MQSELVIHEKPKSNISEDIRTIRTNLQFTSLDSKTLLVTSSVQGEGKSFISSNLAVAFAQNGEKTVIVDSDLRLGRLHKIFGTSNRIGLSNLLVNTSVKELPKYIKKTSIDNLYVITRGVVPPNPSELLDSDNLDKLIDFLKTMFDHIIFDGVPVNGLSDSLILANKVDRVILVSACNYTKIEELDNSKKALENIGAKIAGVVMNRAPQNRRGKYSRYYE